ncbi:MAG: hypothetical protein KatS3mg124_1605 [Porticoccaceae bacterium]|nr:MAG: hypothetical protein KatS3mg124_1605 [Porticoccaceae bacterium]
MDAKGARGPSFRRGPGFTAIELMVVVAVVALLAAMAVPAFQDLLAKRRVKGAAEEIHGLLLQARHEVPLRERDVTAVFADSADPWCVGLTLAATCDCGIQDPTDPDACTLPVAGTPVLQVLQGDEFPGVALESTFTADHTTFRHPRLTANAGSVRVTSGDFRLDVVVSPQGRIRICNPNDNAMPGYLPCN